MNLSSARCGSSGSCLYTRICCFIAALAHLSLSLLEEKVSLPYLCLPLTVSFVSHVSPVSQEAKAANERIQLEEELLRQRRHFESIIAAKDTQLKK